MGAAAVPMAVSWPSTGMEAPRSKRTCTPGCTVSVASGSTSTQYVIR
jgi:hypothetical protein